MLSRSQRLRSSRPRSSSIHLCAGKRPGDTLTARSRSAIAMRSMPDLLAGLYLRAVDSATSARRIFGFLLGAVHPSLRHRATRSCSSHRWCSLKRHWSASINRSAAFIEARLCSAVCDLGGRTRSRTHKMDSQIGRSLIQAPQRSFSWRASI